MNVCSIWPFAQISDDFYYLDIWQCARYFVAALFKGLAFITITEMWGLEFRSRTSRSWSRLLWQSLGLGHVSKFEPGLGLGGYGLDCITALYWEQRCTAAGVSEWTPAGVLTNFENKSGGGVDFFKERPEPEWSRSRIWG